MKIPTQALTRDHCIGTRRDPVTHLKIDQALATQRAEGTKSAAQRLAANGIALDVAARVLGASTLRRRQP